MRVVKQIKIQDNDDSLTELYGLKESNDLLYRYPLTGSLSVHVWCRYCIHFRKEFLEPNRQPCMLQRCVGVDGDTLLVYDNGKYDIKVGSKHIKNFLKAVKAK